MRVAVVGGGAVGACSAYYLTQSDSPSCQVILLEQSDNIANGASGKAGGFLALDWCDSDAYGTLARKGFQLHQKFADLLGPENIEYRRMHAISVEANAFSRSEENMNHGNDGKCGWLDQAGVSRDTIHVMGTEETCAQVHPEKFTRAVVVAAKKTGKLHVRLRSRVSGLVIEDDAKVNERVSGVVLEDGEVIKADYVVLAMGAWTNLAFNWLKLERNAWEIEGEKYHSIIVKPQPEKEVPAAAVFLNYRTTKRAKQEHPEIYPRPCGLVYLCGKRTYEKLPNDPALALPLEKCSEELFEIAKSVSSNFHDAEVVQTQACYLPVTIRKDKSQKAETSNLPVIGQMSANVKNVLVASGSNYWGILTSPAVGLAISELIASLNCSATGTLSFDLDPFRP